MGILPVVLGCVYFQLQVNLLYTGNMLVLLDNQSLLLVRSGEWAEFITTDAQFT